MDFLIPSRRNRPGDDPIFSLHAEAKRRAAEGVKVINATIGALLDDGGQLMVMPSVVQALANVKPQITAGYAPIAGRPEFRRAIADDLLAGVGLADQTAVVATPGGTGALRLAIDNFLEPGQALLTSSYFWAPYRTLADESGRQLVTFNMLIQGSGALDIADFDRQLGALLAQQGRALVILNTPCHNPTGYTIDQEEWDQLRAAIERHATTGPIAIVLDVAYAYYAPEALRACIENLAKLTDKVLVMFAWSASKAFLQYGLRVGGLVAVVPDEPERDRIERAITYSCRGIWSNCNAGGMAAIAGIMLDESLRAKADEERAGAIAMLAGRVECWNELATAAGLPYPRYNGGFFTTVLTAEAKSVAAKLRDERGIFLVPLAKAIRVGICAVNNEQIGQIVAALQAAM